MRGDLKRKTTRTVHGEKVVRLRIDIPFEEVDVEGGNGQDVHEWLDHKVGDEINLEILPFNDEEQTAIQEMLERDNPMKEPKPGEEERNIP